jgi:hypothetical protein
LRYPPLWDVYSLLCDPVALLDLVFELSLLLGVL